MISLLKCFYSDNIGIEFWKPDHEGQAYNIDRPCADPVNSSRTMKT